MSYSTQADMAQDPLLQRRVAACAATQGIGEPLEWSAASMWQLSAEPGWDAAYSSALAAENPAPGRDEAVISDPMILSAVQALKGGVA